MAIKEYFIGSKGPFEYDDTEFPNGIHNTGAIQSEKVPTDPNDMVRLSDLTGAFAPTDASYVVIGLDSGLSNERVLAVNTTNLSLVDSGANAAVTINTIQDIDVTATPQFSGLSLQDSSSAQQFDVITYTNTNTDDTISSIRQIYKVIAFPSGLDTAVIVVIGEEQSWTADPATRDSYYAISTSLNSVVAEKFRITSDGSIGMGIAIPITPLHLYEDNATVNHTTGFLIEQDGAGDAKLQWLITGLQRWGMGIDNSDSDKLKIGTVTDLASATHMVFTTGGNVGIGTNAPGSPLEISSTAAVHLHINGKDSGVAETRYTNTTDTDGWYTGITGAEKFGISRNIDMDTGAEFIITQAGLVGFGTNAPIEQFTVYAATAGYAQFDLVEGGTIGSPTTRVQLVADEDSSRLGTNTAHDLGLFTGNDVGSPHILLDDDADYTIFNKGNVGIAQPVPRATLDVTGIITYTAASELTIASGVITATQNYHTVDTQDDDPSDDLDTINGGVEGMILVFQPASAARTVVCKDGTGNLRLVGDFSLDTANDCITLFYNGTNWMEISRSDNA